MKLTWGKKTVLFLHWLMSLLLAALCVVLCVEPQWVDQGVTLVNSVLGGVYAGICGIALLAVYALLAALSIAFVFGNGEKKSERGFITVDSSEAGRTRIAVGAVDQMIRQAVRSVDGIVDMKSSIRSSEDAVSIHANVTIASGVHVPTVTMNLQRAVRSYIELNCGVAVREICVSVSALESGADGGRHGRRRFGESAKSNVCAAEAPSVIIPAKDAQTPSMELPVEEAAAAAQPEAEVLPAEASVDDTLGLDFSSESFSGDTLNMDD